MTEKAKQILSSLTLEEKTALLSGVNSWETTPISRVGLPGAFVADGPHGVRKEMEVIGKGNIFTESYPSTCFPPAVTLANTWDRELVGEIGKALGEECLGLKVDTILGPGINIKRNPMCGRNFEYFSEDPYLAGEMGVAYVNGVQSTGVGTSLKHFAVNSQEYRRMNADSEVDERTLREIYLSAFEKVIKLAAPYTVMCSYNKVNGTYASENKTLLTDILRKEWGYEGIVVSDWGAVCDRIKGVLAGMNLEMPSSNGVRDKEVLHAVQNGDLSEEAVDAVIGDVIDFVLKCDANRKKHKDYTADYAAHHELARRAAAEGTVLLKNKGSLPLDASANIAVVGAMAKHIRSQGSGSSRLKPMHEVSFTDCLDNLGVKYEYEDGYDIKGSGAVRMNGIYKACKAAIDKDAVIVFIGLTDAYESEAFDRDHIELPPVHNALVEEVCKYNDNVIVALTGGSPMTMPWLSKVKAVVDLQLGGEAGGEATYDVLFGKVNPCGKLAETYPLNAGDVPSTQNFAKDSVEYAESIYVGYRYFCSADKQVLFPFGYGLSYTEFKYDNLKLSSEKLTDGEELTVTFDVTNIGERDGAEIAEVYVKDTESTIFVAERQLKGFQKIFLKAGETKTVEIKLDKRAFAFYNVNCSDWTVEAGEFQILVCSDAKTTKLVGKVYYDAPSVAIPDYRNVAPAYYEPQKGLLVTVKQFEAVLGRPVTEFKRPKKGEYNFETMVRDLTGWGFPNVFRKIMTTCCTWILPRGTDAVTKKMTIRGAQDMPIRNFFAMSGGAFPYESCVGLLEALNGKTVRGVIKLIKGLRRKVTSKKDIYK